MQLNCILKYICFLGHSVTLPNIFGTGAALDVTHVMTLVGRCHIGTAFQSPEKART